MWMRPISTIQIPSLIISVKSDKAGKVLTSWEKGINITVKSYFSSSGCYILPMFVFSHKENVTSVRRKRTYRGGVPLLTKWFDDDQDSIYRITTTFCKGNQWINLLFSIINFRQLQQSCIPLFLHVLPREEIILCLFHPTHHIDYSH